jgi:hypothetical protein
VSICFNGRSCFNLFIESIFLIYNLAKRGVYVCKKGCLFDLTGGAASIDFFKYKPLQKGVSMYVKGGVYLFLGSALKSS